MTEADGMRRMKLEFEVREVIIDAISCRYSKDPGFYILHLSKMGRY